MKRWLKRQDAKIAKFLVVWDVLVIFAEMRGLRVRQRVGGCGWLSLMSVQVRKTGFVLVGLVMLGLAALHWMGPGIVPDCLIHRFTGWHCPGCGIKRAMKAVMEGRMWDAFRLNPFLVVLLPFVGAWLVWMRFRRNEGERNKRLDRVVGIVVLVVLVCYGILRNIPLWPFSLLAPI